MLLVTVILAFILVANGRSCVWLKNEEGAGKLTSLMESSSGPAEFNFNSVNRYAKYIDIHLSDSLDVSSNSMTIIINIGNYVVEESRWVSLDNLDLNVLFAYKNVESANQTKYLRYSLKANISFHLKKMLKVYTRQGSFVFDFELSAEQTRQNPSESLTVKLKKFVFNFLQRQQTKILYMLLSVFVMGSDIYFMNHYDKQTSFRLSRTASALYVFSQIIYLIEIFNISQLDISKTISAIFLLFTAVAKITMFLMKFILLQNAHKHSLRDIIEEGIIIVIGITLAYQLYFLALVYCIIRDTQAGPQMEYTQDLISLSRCKTFAIILFLPAFKLIYGLPNGFPFDSAFLGWTYLFMLVYLSFICEINYRGGVKTCILNAKQILSAKMGDYYSILKNREVKNEEGFKMAEEDSQLDKKDDEQSKKQMKQKSK